MKIESNKNWTTCLRLNTGDGSPRVFLLNSHFLGSVPSIPRGIFIQASIENSNFKSIHPQFEDRIDIFIPNVDSRFKVCYYS